MQELRATIVQVIRDLYHKRGMNLPKILTLYSANLRLKQRTKQIISHIHYFDPERRSDAYQLAFLIIIFMVVGIKA